MDARAPELRAIIAITEATPMITPRVVSAERTLFRRRARSAMRRVFRTSMVRPPPRGGAGTGTPPPRRAGSPPGRPSRPSRRGRRPSVPRTDALPIRMNFHANCGVWLEFFEVLYVGGLVVAGRAKG